MLKIISCCLIKENKTHDVIIGVVTGNKKANTEEVFTITVLSMSFNNFSSTLRHTGFTFAANQMMDEKCNWVKAVLSAFLMLLVFPRDNLDIAFSVSGSLARIKCQKRDTCTSREMDETKSLLYVYKWKQSKFCKNLQGNKRR